MPEITHESYKQVREQEAPDGSAVEQPTYQLIGEWIDLVNDHGRDSVEATRFLAANDKNKEFCRLLKASDALREMFAVQ